MPTEETQWFFSEGQEEERRGVATVVHGLNQKPSTMDTIVRLLQQSNVDVLRVALTGHHGDSAEWKRVTRERWLEDMLNAYDSISERANDRSATKFFVGNSLGALINLDLMEEHPEHVRYDKMALFAPAIAIRRRCYLMKIAALFPSLSVPSANLRDYRANGGTTGAAYAALFSSLETLQQRTLQHCNIPTLVFIDPNDELVDEHALSTLINHGLDHWSVELVQNERCTLRRKIHHLITDEATVGSEQWSKIEHSIKRHFNLTHSSKT